MTKEDIKKSELIAGGVAIVVAVIGIWYFSQSKVDQPNEKDPKIAMEKCVTVCNFAGLVLDKAQYSEKCGTQCICGLKKK